MTNNFQNIIFKNLKLSISWILNRLEIVIVSSQSKCNHQSSISCELKVRIEEGVSGAYHDGIIAVLDQLDKLETCVEANGNGDRNTEAKSLPCSFVLTPIW